MQHLSHSDLGPQTHQQKAKSYVELSVKTQDPAELQYLDFAFAAVGFFRTMLSLQEEHRDKAMGKYEELGHEEPTQPRF